MVSEPQTQEYWEDRAIQQRRALKFFEDELVRMMQIPKYEDAVLMATGARHTEAAAALARCERMIGWYREQEAKP
jgi:hypothetical protein